jgi:hypothetical protein
MTSTPLDVLMLMSSYSNEPACGLRQRKRKREQVSKSEVTNRIS